MGRTDALGRPCSPTAGTSQLPLGSSTMGSTTPNPTVTSPSPVPGAAGSPTGAYPNLNSTTGSGSFSGSGC